MNSTEHGTEVSTPSTNGHNGRGPDGRFVRGNRGGPGNPDAQRVARLRAAVLRAVTAADVRDVVKSLVAAAREGDIAAAKIVLDRVFGKASVLELEAAQRVEGMQCERCGRQFLVAGDQPYCVDCFLAILDAV